eukprot:TRINITY_DN47558_c0_g2_i1.p1 TRINITY_DN47558_c0_g2~~TRINITY_DN47558_c0_g2_i1.p1  ORF type:complete len:571 (+),score=10.41 TRINITY_DN47558_c0_g2_i1:77-1789(+)
MYYDAAWTGYDNPGADLYTTPWDHESSYIQGDAMGGSVVTGPVIGLVTDTTARIMAELPISGPVTCTIHYVPYHKEDKGPPESVTVDVMAYRPAIFVFSNLTPESFYRVEFEEFSHVPSSFYTFPSFPTLDYAYRFGVIACNKHRITQESIQPHADVWTGVADQVRASRFALLLHLGDQIYADDNYGKVEKGKKTVQEIASYCVYARAQQLLDSTPREQWHWQRPTIIEMYRQAYRECWNHPPTAEVLANVPNLMVYDDHELKDDLGDKPEHLEHCSVSRDRTILECGRKATLEYQKQLLYDVDVGDDYDAPTQPIENHLIHSLGDYGILMLDSRGAKTFKHDPTDPLPYLTTPQWHEINAALSPGGELSQCRVLICCCQIPLVFFTRSMTERLAPKGDDFEGHWSYGINQTEQYMLLDLLESWAGLNRTVVLAGGDMHLGGYTHVYKHGRYFCGQVLVGPVANTLPANSRMKATKLINAMQRKLGDGWEYKHYDWFNKCNIGYIDTFPTHPHFALGHIVGSSKKGIYEFEGKPPAKKQKCSSCMVCVAVCCALFIAIIVGVVILIVHLT